MKQEELEMIELAKSVATFAHHGQTRKGTSLPYFTHCHDVAVAVAKRGGDSTAIAAAYLHDVLEDTTVTAHQLSFEYGFPQEVIDVVVELTDVYTHQAYPDLPRRERKKLETKRLSRVSKRAKLVKLCDIEDNDKTIELTGGGFAKVWRTEKAELIKAISLGKINED